MSEKSYLNETKSIEDSIGKSNTNTNLINPDIEEEIVNETKIGKKEVKQEDSVLLIQRAWKIHKRKRKIEAEKKDDINKSTEKIGKKESKQLGEEEASMLIQKAYKRHRNANRNKAGESCEAGNRIEKGISSNDRSNQKVVIPPSNFNRNGIKSSNDKNYRSVDLLRHKEKRFLGIDDKNNKSELIIKSSFKSSIEKTSDESTSAVKTEKHHKSEILKESSETKTLASTRRNINSKSFFNAKPARSAIRIDNNYKSLLTLKSSFKSKPTSQYDASTYIDKEIVVSDEEKEAASRLIQKMWKKNYEKLRNKKIVIHTKNSEKKVGNSSQNASLNKSKNSNHKMQLSERNLSKLSQNLSSNKSEIIPLNYKSQKASIKQLGFSKMKTRSERNVLRIGRTFDTNFKLETKSMICDYNSRQSSELVGKISINEEILSDEVSEDSSIVNSSLVEEYDQKSNSSSLFGSKFSLGIRNSDREKKSCTANSSRNRPMLEKSINNRKQVEVRDFKGKKLMHTKSQYRFNENNKRSKMENRYSFFDYYPMRDDSSNRSEKTSKHENSKDSSLDRKSKGAETTAISRENSNAEELTREKKSGTASVSYKESIDEKEGDIELEIKKYSINKISNFYIRSKLRNEGKKKLNQMKESSASLKIQSLYRGYRSRKSILNYITVNEVERQYKSLQERMEYEKEEMETYLEEFLKEKDRERKKLIKDWKIANKTKKIDELAILEKIYKPKIKSVNQSQISKIQEYHNTLIPVKTIGDLIFYVIIRDYIPPELPTRSSIVKSLLLEERAFRIYLNMRPCIVKATWEKEVRKISDEYIRKIIGLDLRDTNAIINKSVPEHIAKEVKDKLKTRPKQINLLTNVTPKKSFDISNIMNSTYTFNSNSSVDTSNRGKSATSLPVLLNEEKNRLLSQGKMWRNRKTISPDVIWNDIYEYQANEKIQTIKDQMLNLLRIILSSKVAIKNSHDSIETLVLFSSLPVYNKEYNDFLSNALDIVDNNELKSFLRQQLFIVKIKCKKYIKLLNKNNIYTIGDLWTSDINRLLPKSLTDSIRSTLKWKFDHNIELRKSLLNCFKPKANLSSSLPTVVI